MKSAAHVTGIPPTPDALTSQHRRYNSKSNRWITNVALEDGEEAQLGGEVHEMQEHLEEGHEQAELE